MAELLADAGQVLIAPRSAEPAIERTSPHRNLVADADRSQLRHLFTKRSLDA